MNEEGEKAGFAKLLDSCESSLRAYLFVCTRDHHAADDLFQETSFSLWERFSQFDHERSFLHWALGFARNKAMKWRASKGRSLLPMDAEVMDRLEAAAVETEGGEDERIDHLKICLESLSKKLAGMLRFRYTGGLSILEVAQKLQMKESAIKIGLLRARLKLKECVERKLLRT
ncbi:MAG: sigma-70 family RNA polymerase sigma factor [Planctomycetes bacterium]|nr:sigma-70 family RNA polymerase sigma factor [Planctomycetota bacterium]